MLALLTKLLPFRDWIYAALAVAAVAGWFYHDHVIATQAVAHERAAVAAASAKAEHDAESRVAALAAQHTAELIKLKVDYDAQISHALAAHVDDVQRLRDYDTYRRAHPVLVGAVGTLGQALADGSDSFAALGAVSAELADALRHDDAALTACYADRDALTGK